MVFHRVEERCEGKPLHCEILNLFMKLKQFREQASTERCTESSSEKEHKVNALASGAEEGRDKLR